MVGCRLGGWLLCWLAVTLGDVTLPSSHGKPTSFMTGLPRASKSNAFKCDGRMDELREEGYVFWECGIPDGGIVCGFVEEKKSSFPSFMDPVPDDDSGSVPKEGRWRAGLSNAFFGVPERRRCKRSNDGVESGGGWHEVGVGAGAASTVVGCWRRREDERNRPCPSS